MEGGWVEGSRVAKGLDAQGQDAGMRYTVNEWPWIGKRGSKRDLGA